MERIFIALYVGDMRKDIRDNRTRKRNKRSVASTALLTFAITLIVTLTLGAILILISSNKIEDGQQNIIAANSGETSSKTRLPNAERIAEDDEDTTAPDDRSGDIFTDINDDSSASNSNDEDGSSDNDSDGALTDGQNGDAETSDENSENGEDKEALADNAWEHNITTANDDGMTLAFAGDILFDPGYAIMNSIRQRDGIEGVFDSGLLSYMRNSDVMVVNNEFPYSNRGVPTEGKTFTFRANPSSAGLLNDMGVDVATIANNHTYDYGEAALLDTLTALDNVGVARIGAGVNIEEASHPVYYISQSGLKVAIIAATEIERLDNPDTKGATETSPGVFRCLDITKLQNRIREAKGEGAFVIVCIHWGTENQEEIDWWQQKQGPEIAEAGADLIVGGHPHILQKIGYIGSVPVVYSLGNYLFNSKTLDTGLLQVEVHNDHSMNLKFVPAIQTGCTVHEATDGEKARILQHLRDISAGVNIDEDGNIR